MHGGPVSDLMGDSATIAKLVIHSNCEGEKGGSLKEFALFFSFGVALTRLEGSQLFVKMSIRSSVKVTIVYSLNLTSKAVDGPPSKDYSGRRDVSFNIIPSSTRAAKASREVLSSLHGKLTGMAIQVPTMDVSSVHLTVKLTKKAKNEELDNILNDAFMD
ncbi:hypothetical protein F2P56_009248 [Juglans regia]|uniref:glyceraldehyde-3-phosphate dehydrogenase (phosphorylating) n=1 Tax=Juglans regia TaxID=51240 RepID=A0A833XWT6_JUGRE|nr:hypothetical protein F2P56_009248 [Juglans regia]